MEKLRQFQWLIIVVMVCATVLVVVWLLRPQADRLGELEQRLHEEKIACLEGGGRWGVTGYDPPFAAEHCIQPLHLPDIG